MTAQATLGLALANTALANRGTIDTKAKAPVCEDTFGSAVCTPTDKRGFVSPEFWGLVCSRRFHMVMAGWATPQGWPHGLSHVTNIPPTLCVS